ncbi:nitrilase [Pseudoxanthomonas kalamensis DSM 18571]|uniref:carbon-nitrogen hydrolase family protein n=1 Tax=Pseudoxanthomonas kalamensis TaxID=289483 RepID=UPI00139157EC|nr:carbon-nitrogen hydrolase family protein [Pseudoxanthomonas kalamensis]KAF1710419.1 nitrilase [Pseudoxanthomonas kalamensis DSM 18571]
MRIAVAKYPVGKPGKFSAFADKQERLVGDAAEQGAQLAVLPEYLSLELASCFASEVQVDLQATLAAVQPLHEEWMALFSALAVQYRLHLLAGSFLLRNAEGRYRNRAYWFSPDGRHGWQDKLQLTGFEKATGVIDGGDVLRVFDVAGVRAGIAVCYDSEFPLPVRAQCEAGARLLLVPSCTDTDAGAMRVRIGCLARALENRIFVAQAVTAGEAPWNPALDVNTGEATIYAPMDRGFPADGIVAQTRGDQVWALADLDFEAFESSRAQAQVANDRDWDRQLAPAIARARVERL